MGAKHGKSRKMRVQSAEADFETLEEMPEEETAMIVTAPEAMMQDIPHAEPGTLQAVKTAIKGHGEQIVLPDDCEFGDNDLCYVES